jgi:hypothetical protein
VYVDDVSGPSNPIVYIDHSEIRDGRVAELKVGIRRLVEFIESREPQLVAYAFYLDERAAQMTVVAVHPDSASLELHLETGGPEFRNLADMITLQEVVVYGSPSPRALAMLQQKANALGGASVSVHERFAGFAHIT